jgi:predicted nuclease of predicted toxin-antitoxin system
MRVLLDENLDHRLRRSFDRSIEVTTVAELGWKGKRNSELLELASREFDAFITGDQNLEYQQNVAYYTLGIIVLVAQSNRSVDRQPLIPRVCEMLPTLRPSIIGRVAATTPPEAPETHNRGASGRS